MSICFLNQNPNQAPPPTHNRISAGMFRCNIFIYFLKISRRFWFFFAKSSEIESTAAARLSSVNPGQGIVIILFFEGYPVPFAAFPQSHGQSAIADAVIRNDIGSFLRLGKVIQYDAGHRKLAQLPGRQHPAHGRQ